MPPGGAFPPDPALPAFAGGPCPACPGKGALLILRREPDARLLFHCPSCGLAFTHEPAGREPEYGKSLAAVAPRGSRPATEPEIRAAGLWEHARPWAPPPPPPKVDPAKAFLRDAPVAPRKPLPALRPSSPSGSAAAKTLGGGALLFLIFKLIAMALMHSHRR